MRRLQVLVVTPSLPHPPMWGFGIRVNQLARHLAERHDVSLLAYAGRDDEDKVSALRPFCREIHTVTLPRPLHVNDRRRQLASLVSAAPYHALHLRTPEMASAVRGLVARRRYDVIQVESSPMAGFDFGQRARLVLDEHNLEYELLQRTYQAERNPVRKAYTWLEYLKFKREEQRCWDGVAGCVLTSEREQSIVASMAPLVPTAVVPNGVDVDFFAPSDVAPDPDSIVFTGLIRYRPNTEAIVHFVREVLPLIHRTRPAVTFTIVGWGVPDEVKRLLGPRVVATERVPDVRPYLARAGAVVVPLRMGSGTRLKVLEGLSMARPMVSTSIGCEGIGVEDGSHLLVRDEPAAFADAVLRLLDDPAEGARLGRNGRALVSGRYGWKAVAGRLEDFLLEVSAGRAPAEAV